MLLTAKITILHNTKCYFKILFFDGSPRVIVSFGSLSEIISFNTHTFYNPVCIKHLPFAIF